jgi:hypothetical protein
MAPCSGLANKGPVCPLCLPAVLRLQRAERGTTALDERGAEAAICVRTAIGSTRPEAEIRFRVLCDRK